MPSISHHTILINMTWYIKILLSSRVCAPTLRSTILLFVSILKTMRCELEANFS